MQAHAFYGVRLSCYERSSTVARLLDGVELPAGTIAVFDHFRRLPSRPRLLCLQMPICAAARAQMTLLLNLLRTILCSVGAAFGRLGTSAWDV